MRISDWSSDECSSELLPGVPGRDAVADRPRVGAGRRLRVPDRDGLPGPPARRSHRRGPDLLRRARGGHFEDVGRDHRGGLRARGVVGPAGPPAAPLGVRARLPHVPALDGLRGAAVLGVVAYHAGHLRGGFLGVDLFFVLSGFLITSLLLVEHESTDRIALGAFWGRRFRRLLPAVLVVLAAVALYGALELPASALGDLRRDGLGTLAYVPNWVSRRR